MTQGKDMLADRLEKAMAAAHVTVEGLAQATKVPRSTLLHFLGADVNAVLPARVYLRGHLVQAAREVGVDEAEALSLFDARYPVAQDDDPKVDLERVSTGTMALAAGIASVGILAVILAFTG